MTKQVVFLVALFSMMACNEEKKEKTFQVEGVLKNTSARNIYLELASSGQPVIVDSAKLGSDGKFSIHAEGNEEALYTLRTDNSPLPFAIVINDNKKVSVDADLADARNGYQVKGSEASQALLDFEKSLFEQGSRVYLLKKNIDSLRRLPGAKALELAARDSLRRTDSLQYLDAAAAMKTYAQQTINKSKSPVFILYALYVFQKRSSELGEAGFLKNEMTALINESAARFPQHTGLAEQKRRMVSSKAPEFSLPDTTGKSVALSSFKGKYVLVDFWASWCRPCRMENPNVVAAYNKFKDKNFTILGVSLDREKGAWMQAIKADGLTWSHVSDLQYWNNAAAQLYGVQSIPYNVLLDPDGNIVAENLREQQLHTTLMSVLK